MSIWTKILENTINPIHTLKATNLLGRPRLEVDGIIDRRRDVSTKLCARGRASLRSPHTRPFDHQGSRPVEWEVARMIPYLLGTARRMILRSRGRKGEIRDKKHCSRNRCVTRLWPAASLRSASPQTRATWPRVKHPEKRSRHLPWSPTWAGR